MRIRIAASIAMVGCTFIFWQWAFIRFFHYHSQNHSLNPADYEVQVLTAAEFHRLADPAQETVTFDNGSQTTKAPAWYDIVLPKYKAIENGQRFVLVTAKGTAHFAHRWENDMLPLAMVFISLVVVLGPSIRAPCPTNTIPDKANQQPIGSPDG